jgi:hypothetical protein
MATTRYYTMTEAQWALFTVLDGCIGTKRHDLYDIMSGLPEEEVSRVWAAYEEARNLYNKKEDNNE